MSDIKIEGIERFQKKLKKNVSLDAVKKVVKHYGDKMDVDAKKNAEHFKGHYGWSKDKGYGFIKPSGNLKQGIISDPKRDGLEYQTESTVNYAGYVECGTRFMDAQPYLKPAFKDAAKGMKRDLKRLEK